MWHFSSTADLSSARLTLTQPVLHHSLRGEVCKFVFIQPPAFVVTASGGGKAVRSPPVSEDCDRDSTSRVHSFHNTQVLTVQLVHRQHPPPPLPTNKKKKNSVREHCCVASPRSTGVSGERGRLKGHLHQSRSALVSKNIACLARSRCHRKP